ncbi:MAG: L-2-amino-thiazoline-4-carboxylic acid hydrolase [Lachnospiraceae bacterium]|nr:L-2-amino-thiazoline-4-carboxylic acid hydrolase [Lachnospiraceae bacterium]
MGYRYVPKDLIRHSDFYELYRTFPEDTRRSIWRLVGRFAAENPSYRLPVYMGPGYLMMHWLMSDLYTSLALYLVRKKEGADTEALLKQMDERLTLAGIKLNHKMKRIMKLRGAFSIARIVMPRAMSLANGHGFQVTPVDYGKGGFGFDVTSCPYARLYAKYGAPEIGPVLCRFDDTVGSGMDGISFIRQGTLARGDTKCDFLYQRSTTG